MRLKLPDRRPSVNVCVTWTMFNGATVPIQVTFGLDAETGAVREVFCDDFKSGSDNQAVIMDACVLLSRLMQHNTPLDELAASLCSPPSLIGVIADAAAKFRHEEEQP